MVGGVARAHNPGREAIYFVHAADGRTWKVVRDGSLKNDVDNRGYFHTGELVSPVLAYSDIETLQAVVRAVRTKAKAKVNFSCGIHVHVGSSAIPVPSISNLIKTIHKNEDLLYAALGVSGSRRLNYCRPVEANLVDKIERLRPKTLEELKMIWFNIGSRLPYVDPSTSHYHPSRYHGLNLRNIFFRGTVEFRYFESSLHAGVVKSYVQLVLSMASYAIASSQTSSKKREYNAASGRYDFRVLMNRLGMIGPEFATARHHLLAKLQGDTAFKNGRPK